MSPGFRIQSEILTDFRVLQIAVDCRFIHVFRCFGPGFWTSRVIKIFLPRFQIQGEILTAG